MKREEINWIAFIKKKRIFLYFISTLLFAQFLFLSRYHENDSSSFIFRPCAAITSYLWDHINYNICVYLFQCTYMPIKKLSTHKRMMKKKGKKSYWKIVHNFSLHSVLFGSPTIMLVEGSRVCKNSINMEATRNKYFFFPSFPSSHIFGFWVKLKAHSFLLDCFHSIAQYISYACEAKKKKNFGSGWENVQQPSQCTR